VINISPIYLGLEGSYRFCTLHILLVHMFQKSSYFRILSTADSQEKLSFFCSEGSDNNFIRLIYYVGKQEDEKGFNQMMTN